jgi:hypothetical protein
MKVHMRLINRNPFRADLPTDNYTLASQFDGFRFARLRDERSKDERSAFNYHMVSTSDEYLAFGHGRHACPGRYVFQPMIPYSSTENGSRQVLCHYTTQDDSGSFRDQL